MIGPKGTPSDRDNDDDDYDDDDDNDQRYQRYCFRLSKQFG